MRLALVAVLLFLGLAGSFFGWFHNCEETQRGSTQVKTVCRNPSATDAQVVFVGIALLLLIAPDFEEAGLFGFSLKRRIERQEVRQQALEGQLIAVSSRIDNVAAAKAYATTNVILTRESFQRALADIDGKEPEFREMIDGLRQSVVSVQHRVDAMIADPKTREGSQLLNPFADVVRPQDRELQSEVVALWDELNELVVNPPIRGLMDLVKEPIRTGFRSDFAEEIQLLRAARDAVVDRQILSPDTLRTGAEVGRQLLRIARQALADQTDQGGATER